MKVIYDFNKPISLKLEVTIHKLGLHLHIALLNKTINAGSLWNPFFMLQKFYLYIWVPQKPQYRWYVRCKRP